MIRKQITGQNHRQKVKLILPIICLIILVILLSASQLIDYFQNRRIRDSYITFIESLDSTDFPYQNWLRFALGYIDDDKIPELFLCCGNGHADHVYIYSYIPETDSIYEWGGFSSFGNVTYYERQNVVVSQYGGTGFWYHTYILFEGTQSKNILAIEGINASGKGGTYFWASPYEGTLEDSICFVNSEKYIVSEDVYDQNIFEFKKTYTSPITIDFVEMSSYNRKTFESEWN